MLLDHALVFDDIISGTTSTWYSPSEMNARLGAADAFAVHACTTFVSGTGPTLTVQAEHSSDGESWIATPAPPEISTAIANDSSYWGSRDPYNMNMMGLLRFKITLGGTNPQCRLKLYATGRIYGAAAARPSIPQMAHQQTAARRLPR